MAEQTFKSPGFFEREVDLTTSGETIAGIPAGVIGTAKFGPAFVPITVGSFSSFEKFFGTLDSDRFGPYAVKAFLEHQTAVTYIRVLGAGANRTSADVSATKSSGTVKNAGFKLVGTEEHNKLYKGTVQFVCATHDCASAQSTAYPIFTQNNSIATADAPTLVRGMIFMASGARLEVLNEDSNYSHGNLVSSVTVSDTAGTGTDAGTFKLVLSSALGSTFGNDEGLANIRILTASLNPDNKHYIGKILNTSPDRFHAEQHLLYADFPVDKELADVSYHASNPSVSLCSGSNTVDRDLFGNFNTRYQPAKTTSFISQPYGKSEIDLFYFESLDDGAIANKRVKISIADLRRSIDPNYEYGSFSVLIRKFSDYDNAPIILERYSNCNLDPNSTDYIGAKIGDKKIFYNFDSPHEDDRRLVSTGKYANKSSYVRIVISAAVTDQNIPKTCLPFGFRGWPSLKTTNSLTDTTAIIGKGSASTKLGRYKAALTEVGSLNYAILPPIPFTFKSTKAGAPKSTLYTGEPSDGELTDKSVYWGVRFNRFKTTDLKPDENGGRNKLIDNYTKFLGIYKSDALLSGSGADLFNDNKFTLARVALDNTTETELTAAVATLTDSPSDHIRQAAYIRNAKLKLPLYSIADSIGSHEDRLTFASLASAKSESMFNKFSKYMKFTTFLYGGFDGLNILDQDQRLMNDKGSSAEAGGKAAGGAIGYMNLSSNSSPGKGTENNAVNSYRIASNIITDTYNSSVNIVTIPGIRDTNITKYVANKVEEYSKAIYIMDVPAYDDDGIRIFMGDGSRPNITNLSDNFIANNIDSSYVASYFPDITKFDSVNRVFVNMPASIAALGAYAYNDKHDYPWFAPAGFNRGALSDVSSVDVKLNTEDRNTLYESRINPIASFPNNGYVIFGQKTLQKKKSALDRVNVRRMLLEAKRRVADIAIKFIFEKNTPKIRAKFVSKLVPILAEIQLQEGIDQFKIIMDESNNTQPDIQANKLNGRIILVPTRAVEFISIDFIITNAGVSFE